MTQNVNWRITKLVFASLLVLFAIPAAAELGSNPENQHAFCIYGIVTDEQARPLPGVRINIGHHVNSCIVRAYTETGQDGRYIYFTDGVGKRFFIGAQYPGYYELGSSCRGDFGLALAPSELSQYDILPGNNLLPATPYRLDFTLVPAVQMNYRLLDAQGQPIYWADLWANNPQDVTLDHVYTRENDINYQRMNVPPGRIGFTVKPPEKGETRSAPVVFPHAGNYDITLVLDDNATPPTLTVTVDSTPPAPEITLTQALKHDADGPKDGKRPYGPEQAAGSPDTRHHGDAFTAWSPWWPEDKTVEWLELDYDRAVYPKTLRVYESYCPGALTKVSVFDADNNESVAWEGIDPAFGYKVGIAEIPLKVENEIKRVKLYFSFDDSHYRNGIDAVELVDREGYTQWATAARASSTLADKKRSDPIVSVK